MIFVFLFVTFAKSVLMIVKKKLSLFFDFFCLFLIVDVLLFLIDDVDLSSLLLRDFCELDESCNDIIVVSIDKIIFT